MKRLFLLLAAIAVVFFGCNLNNNTGTHSMNGKINVTATIFPPYDFVRQIAGDRVNLTMLLLPGTESHSFEPSPRDILTIQNSGIFIYAGGNSNKWVDRILQSMDMGNMKILSMMDAVDTVEEEIVEGMKKDKNEDGIVYDEHVWTSPRNAILIVKAITGLLCEADPGNSAFYLQNSAEYQEKLAQLDAGFFRIIAGAKRNVIVFADRFPFRYFADAYSLNYFAAFPGCSAETEPSAATVAFLVNKIRAEKIPAVFHLELSNERMADTICGETGAKKLLLHSCHNITKHDFDSGFGYIELMLRNAENLRQALY